MFALVWAGISLVWNLVWAKCPWDTQLCPPEDNGAHLFGSQERVSKLEAKILEIKTKKALKSACKS